jgi:phosphoglycolate phosphatase
MTPSTLLYDWDNTLVDGWAGITAALNAVFDAFAMPAWSVADTRERVRVSLRDSFPPMFGAEWERARDIFYAAFEEQHRRNVAPMPGAADALTAGAAWPQGVVSNKAGRYLRAEVEHLGWTPHFGAVIGAGDAARRTARSGISATRRLTCTPPGLPASPPCWSAMPRMMVGLTGRVPISISPLPSISRHDFARLRDRGVSLECLDPAAVPRPPGPEQRQPQRQEEGSCRGQ